MPNFLRSAQDIELLVFSFKVRQVSWEMSPREPFRRAGGITLTSSNAAFGVLESFAV